jgi:hypothetical protein
MAAALHRDHSTFITQYAAALFHVLCTVERFTDSIRELMRTSLSLRALGTFAI